MPDYKFHANRRSVSFTHDDGVTITSYPWTDDPENNPGVAGNGDYARLKAQLDAGEIEIAEPDPEPAPPAPVTWKSDIWDRATEQEANVIEAAINGKSAKKKNFFNSVSEIRHDHPLFEELRQGFIQAVGKERTNVLLAPSTSA